MDRLGKADFLETETDNASVVTSASRNAKNLENLPFTAYVITKEMIAQRGYQTLVDIIKDLPGTRVSQPAEGISLSLLLPRRASLEHPCGLR